MLKYLLFTFCILKISLGNSKETANSIKLFDYKIFKKCNDCLNNTDNVFLFITPDTFCVEKANLLDHKLMISFTTKIDNVTECIEYYVNGLQYTINESYKFKFFSFIFLFIACLLYLIIFVLFVCTMLGTKRRRCTVNTE